MSKRRRYPVLCRLFGHKMGPWDDDLATGFPYRACTRRRCSHYEMR